ncbi:glutaredoxin, partial [Ancylostoma duodenale]
HFYASWAPPCEQVNKVLDDLQEDYKSYPIGFAFIDAEGVAEVSAAHSIAAAPTLIYFKGGKEVDRVNGYKPSDIEMKLTQHSFDLTTASPPASAGNKDLFCYSFHVFHLLCFGFSKQMVGLLNDINADFGSFDILSNEEVRQGLKFSGSNIFKGFSRQMIELLNGVGADYDTFDILKDEEVRQGLKTYSNWPTYPQLYLNGELLGGLDVVRAEMADESFVSSLPKRS